MEEKEHPAPIKRAVHLLPLSLLIAGITAIVFCATISPTFWDYLGLLLIISLAALLGGAVLGFLFGIPRLNRDYDPRDEGDRRTKYTPNTNLEDVSDWLTKIIIGVTLTQLANIPGYFRGIADSILTDTTCAVVNCAFAKPSIISLLIYFIIAGFLTGYVYTRLYLPNLFAIMEENRIKEAESLLWKKGMKNATQSGEEQETATRLSALTEEENALLRKIKSHNNRLTDQYRLTVREKAAVNVLLAKGIVAVHRERLPEGKEVVCIVDEELLLRLQ